MAGWMCTTQWEPSSIHAECHKILSRALFFLSKLPLMCREPIDKLFRGTAGFETNGDESLFHRNFD